MLDGCYKEFERKRIHYASQRLYCSTVPDVFVGVLKAFYEIVLRIYDRALLRRTAVVWPGTGCNRLDPAQPMAVLRRAEKTETQVVRSRAGGPSPQQT